MTYTWKGILHRYHTDIISGILGAVSFSKAKVSFHSRLRSISVLTFLTLIFYFLVQTKTINIRQIKMTEAPIMKQLIKYSRMANVYLMTSIGLVTWNRNYNFQVGGREPVWNYRLKRRSPMHEIRVNQGQLSFWSWFSFIGNNRYFLILLELSKWCMKPTHWLPSTS